MNLFSGFFSSAWQGAKDIADITKQAKKAVSSSELWNAYKLGLAEMNIIDREKFYEEYKEAISVIDTPNSIGASPLLDFDLSDIPSASNINRVDTNQTNEEWKPYKKPKIRHRKKLENKKRVAEIEPNLIVKKFDSLRVDAKFNFVKVGSYSDVYNFTINSKMVTALKAKQELELQLGVQSVDMYGGDIGGTINMIIPRKDTRILWLEDYIYRTSPRTLEFVLGESVSEIVTQDFKRLPHLIISGGTGSGKTATIDSMLYTFVMNNTPEDLNLVIIDPKVVGLAKYSSIPHLWTPPILDNPEESYETLLDIVEEMGERYTIMAQNPTKKVEDLFPRMVVVIDELADLIDSDFFEKKENEAKKDILSPINKIARKGRQCGIHLLLATQTARADIMRGQLKANVMQWVLSATNKNEVKVTGVVGSDKLRGNGDGYFKQIGSTEYQRVQAPFINEEDVIKLIKDIKLNNQAQSQ
jgi:S-DNA-T family DNA segregation ATPase FtsK/SpoIIIE